MRIAKHLVERLARLEARVEGLPDPQAERESERIATLHGNTYFAGGSLEDIPEKDRDPSFWETLCTFVPMMSEMVEEGLVRPPRYTRPL